VTGRTREIAASALRAVHAGGVFAAYAAEFAGWRLTYGREASNEECVVRLAKRYADAARRLRGGYVKIGQLLATRADLLPAAAVDHLNQLQEGLPAQLTPEDLKHIEEELKQRDSAGRVRIDEAPIGCGSIAQVHVAHLADGRKIALKIMLPDSRRRIASDVKVVTSIARWIARLPIAASIPVNETMAMVAQALRQQTDFASEIASTKRFAGDFAGVQTVRFPAVDDRLSGASVIATDYLDGLHRFDQVCVASDVYRAAALSALRALFEMIFRYGHVHCDLHPGNLKYDDHGVPVFLDCGFVADIDAHDREDFIEFFLSLALNKGEYAADIMRRKALHVGADFDADAFRREVVALVRTFSGKTAAEFQVARLVGALFALQQRYGLYSTPNFSMIIIALLSIEGVIRQNMPDLDFQAVAVEVLLDRPNWRR